MGELLTPEEIKGIFLLHFGKQYGYEAAKELLKQLPDCNYAEAIAEAQLTKVHLKQTRYDVLEEIWAELILECKTRKAPQSYQDFHLILEAVRINLCKKWGDAGEKGAAKHRLDRPDREKIARIITGEPSKVNEKDDPLHEMDVMNNLDKADQILDLWPDVEQDTPIVDIRPETGKRYKVVDVEEIRKQIKRELCDNCDSPLIREGELYQKLEEAKHKERERIMKTTCRLAIIYKEKCPIKQTLKEGG